MVRATLGLKPIVVQEIYTIAVEKMIIYSSVVWHKGTD